MESCSLVENVEHATECAEILKAVSHPLRLRIIAAIVRRNYHVKELSELFDVQQSMISQQLRILRMNGLVGVNRTDGYAWYHLTEPKMVDLVRCMEEKIRESTEPKEISRRTNRGSAAWDVETERDEL